MSDPHELTIYTVYWNTLDYPGKFVVRRSRTGGRTYPKGMIVNDAQPVYVGDSLRTARGFIPPGLYRMPRWPTDDPVIMETWQ